MSANPFPSSVELDLLPGAASSGALRPFLANLAAVPAVEEVQFDVDWVRRLRGVVRLVAVTGAATGFCLACIERLALLRQARHIFRCQREARVECRRPFRPFSVTSYPRPDSGAPRRSRANPLSVA